jgi:enoyl-CoA hydratase/carnithine racemase
VWRKAFDEFAANPDLWVAIVTGAGEKAFSAGNDLKFAASGQKSPVPMPASGFGGLTSRYDLYKPVIAAVNGFAMGGGFEIALATDIIIAAENAKFALPEPKVGFAALASGMHRLPREVPLKKAMGMMLTGRVVGAAEGKEIGFVTDVVPQGKALEEAKRWAGHDHGMLPDGYQGDQGNSADRPEDVGPQDCVRPQGSGHRQTARVS